MRMLKILLGVFAGVSLVAVILGLRFWWNYGYSRGARTGIIRKVSEKGPPYCKYLSAELVLQGNLPGQALEVWEFSVDDNSDKNPLVQQLYTAAREGSKVTIQYRQDHKSLYRCTPSEYFATGLER